MVIAEAVSLKQMLSIDVFEVSTGTWEATSNNSYEKGIGSNAKAAVGDLVFAESNTGRSKLFVQYLNDNATQSYLGEEAFEEVAEEEDATD